MHGFTMKYTNILIHEVRLIQEQMTWWHTINSCILEDQHTIFSDVHENGQDGCNKSVTYGTFIMNNINCDNFRSIEDFGI